MFANFVPVGNRDLCVCDFATLLEVCESAISHQSRTLRSLSLVSYEKRGKKGYYLLFNHQALELSLF
ncbi:ArsR family transcriptional regulator [Pleurocapsa sp. PCC 7319]|uniref:ArsR family transcriptional regulator n=1 Tax=Pleurocapsa sp. PCC 7319 TaxID=118161 RepID=UPI00034A88DF|nr:ArsR family transcriptional regulator [Pleurocapsa sp. PCC 7319]